MKLDLHGIKHEDVPRLMDAFIWEHMQKKSTYIQVVTGNSSTMKQIVKNVVAEYGFDVSDEFSPNGQVMINLV